MLVVKYQELCPYGFGCMLSQAVWVCDPSTNLLIYWCFDSWIRGKKITSVLRRIIYWKPVTELGAVCWRVAAILSTSCGKKKNTFSWLATFFYPQSLLSDQRSSPKLQVGVFHYSSLITDHWNPLVMFSYRCYSITWLLDLLGCRHCMAPSRSSLRLKSWDESDSSLIHWSLQKYSELYSDYKVIQKYHPLEIADLHSEYSDPNKSKNIDRWCRVSVQILILLLDHFTGRSSMSTRVDLMSPSRTETWENETGNILKGSPSKSAASMPDWKIEMLQCQLSHKRPTGYFMSTSCWIEVLSCVPCFPTGSEDFFIKQTASQLQSLQLPT